MSTSTAQMAFPPIHIVDPQQGHPHTHTLIMLHGRGSTAEEFAEEFLESSLESQGVSNPQTLQTRLPSWRLVFPCSKDLHNAVFGEFPQWFDIASLTYTASRPELQIPGLRDSIDYLSGVVKDEAERLGGRYENLVLGGISMGCATAIWTMLKCNMRLGGFVGASGWLPFADEMSKYLRKDGQAIVLKEMEEGEGTDVGRAFVEDVLAGSKRQGVLDTPVFLGHGLDDRVVEYQLGKQASDALVRVGFKVDWREYEGVEQERESGEVEEDDGHWFKDEEVEDIVKFLENLGV